MFRRNPIRLLSLAGVATLITALAWSAPAALDRVPSLTRLDEAGVQLELEWTSPDGDGVITTQREMQLQLTLKDRTSQQALSGARPRVWASHVGSAVAAAESCTDRVKRLASGRLSARADVDLNGYKLLTLNNDKSLSILDPQVRVGTTRLEAIVTLPEDGADWALLDAQGWVAVTLPKARAVALVDLSSRRLSALIETGPSGEPRRVLHEPRSNRVWVALDAADEVIAIDLAERKVVRRVPVGGGFHALAFGADARTLLVTSSASGDLAVVDTQSGRVRHRVAVGPASLPLTYSSASGHAYVAAIGDPNVLAIDPANGQVVRRVVIAPGVVALRSDPSGRFVLAVSERESRVWAIDSADGRVVGSANVVDHPDQVVFTNRFGYVRGLDSIKVSLIDLAALRRGSVEVTDVPMFRAPATSVAQHINVADMIVSSPDGDGAIIAGTADTALYSYMEGMMAPQGTFDTARRTPRGVMVLDRSMRETAPGTYVNRFRFERPGRYVVPILLSQPRLTQCVEVVVDGTVPAGQSQRLLVSLKDPGSPLAAERPQVIRFLVERDPPRSAATGLTDLQVMVLELPGIWQQRQFAREVAPGIYEIEQKFPRGGDYQLTVQSASLGLSFGSTGKIRVRVDYASGASKGSP